MSEINIPNNSVAHVYHRDPGGPGYAAIVDLQALSGGGEGVRGEYVAILQIRTIAGKYHHVSFKTSARSIDMAMKQIMALGKYLMQGNIDSIMGGCEIGRVDDDSRYEIKHSLGKTVIQLNDYNNYTGCHLERVLGLTKMHQRADERVSIEMENTLLRVKSRLVYIGKLIDRKRELEMKASITPKEKEHLQELKKKRKPNLAPHGWFNKEKSLEEIRDELERVRVEIEGRNLEIADMVQECGKAHKKLVRAMESGDEKAVALQDQRLRDCEISAGKVLQQIGECLNRAKACIDVAEEVAKLVPVG